MTNIPQNRRLLFTGEGKGKTTAALGMALRASGHGLRTLIIQFVKSGESTGEINALRHVPEIEIVQTGRGFIPPENDPAFHEHRRSAVEGLNYAADALASGQWDMVILDEVVNAVYKGILDERDVIDAVESAEQDTIVVMTGRYASERLIENVDTVTEMHSVKHGFEAGRKAQKGVEF